MEAPADGPAASAVAEPRPRRSDGHPLSHNLQGQRLGRKGRDTRERIITAAGELLAEPGPGRSITLSEVARRAKLRLGSLYLYFSDLAELLLAVLEPVMAAAEDEFVRLLRPRWSDEELGVRALELVTAYYGFWVRHTRLLHLRNSMADGLDERMLRHRVDLARPIMRLLVAQMDGDARSSGSQPEPSTTAMATVLMTALERVVSVTTDPDLPALLRMPEGAGHRHLLEAQARMIELAIRDFRLLAGREAPPVSASRRCL